VPIFNFWDFQTLVLHNMSILALFIKAIETTLSTGLTAAALVDMGNIDFCSDMNMSCSTMDK
jgi:hypothetical protein